MHTRRGHERWDKVWRSDYNKRRLTRSKLPLQTRVQPENRTMNRECDPWTHACSHPRHTHTRETPVRTGHQRLAPPAHLWTFNRNRRIYFCHPMSQQIKRFGLGDVPCLCSVLQRTLHKCDQQMRPCVTPMIFGWCIIIIKIFNIRTHAHCTISPSVLMLLGSQTQ